MSFIFVNQEDYEQQERERIMYHRIMREGKLDKNGYLIEPPDDMTDEEKKYYQKLLIERHGHIQYTV